MAAAAFPRSDGSQAKKASGRLSAVMACKPDSITRRCGRALAFGMRAPCTEVWRCANASVLGKGRGVLCVWIGLTIRSRPSAVENCDWQVGLTPPVILAQR